MKKLTSRYLITLGLWAVFGFLAATWFGFKFIVLILIAMWANNREMADRHKAFLLRLKESIIKNQTK